jgi:hypothetical protein
MPIDKNSISHVAEMLTDDPDKFIDAPESFNTNVDVRVKTDTAYFLAEGLAPPYGSLAAKIIKAIGAAWGSTDPKELAGQVFTSEFLSDRAELDERTRKTAIKAKLLIPSDQGHWQLSDKAFENAAGGTDYVAKLKPNPATNVRTRNRPPAFRTEGTSRVTPFAKKLDTLLEDDAIDMDEMGSDTAGQSAVANIPAGGADVKKAAEEMGVDSDEAQEMKDKLEQEKEEKEQRDELRKKQIDPLFQQADKGLLDLSTNTATALAQQGNVTQALTGLDDQKNELETLLNKINSLLK